MIESFPDSPHDRRMQECTIAVVIIYNPNYLLLCFALGSSLVGDDRNTITARLLFKSWHGTEHDR